jgi:hypothetical protein
VDNGKRDKFNTTCYNNEIDGVAEEEMEEEAAALTDEDETAGVDDGPTETDDEQCRNPRSGQSINV